MATCVWENDFSSVSHLISCLESVLLSSSQSLPQDAIGVPLPLSLQIFLAPSFPRSSSNFIPRLLLSLSHALSSIAYTFCPHNELEKRNFVWLFDWLYYSLFVPSTSSLCEWIRECELIGWSPRWIRRAFRAKIAKGSRPIGRWVSRPSHANFSHLSSPCRRGAFSYPPPAVSRFCYIGVGIWFIYISLTHWINF